MKRRIAIDLETARDEDMVLSLPTPKPHGGLKDPEKIKADIEAKRVEQVEKMTLDPLYCRICCFSAVGQEPDDSPFKETGVVHENSEEAERDIVERIFGLLKTPGTAPLVITWNGHSFDMPMLYTRALILGVKPIIPLNYWTRKYTYEPHCDLMQAFTNWGGYASLDTYAHRLLGKSKVKLDVKNNHLLISEGRQAEVAERCTVDADLTYQLYDKARGWLF